MSSLPTNKEIKECTNQDVTPIDLANLLISSYNVSFHRCNETGNENGANIYAQVIGDLEDLVGRFAGKKVIIK